MRKLIYILSISLSALTACNMEKEVDLNLPPFQSQLTVECYIQRNAKVQVAVTETTDYFAEPHLPFLNDAKVALSYNGHTDSLKFNPIPNLVEFKYFNYVSSFDSLKLKAGDTYYLEVKDKKGRIVTAQTTWIDPVPLDSVTYRYGEDSSALALIYFRDNGATDDYYRFRVRRQNDTSEMVQDFFTSDDIFNGQATTLGTRPAFIKGDTVELSLYHVDKAYFDFRTSTSDARDANGNPFGQPVVVKTNVTGGTGIFTVLPYDRKVIILK